MTGVLVLCLWLVICRNVLADPQPLRLSFCYPQQTALLNREEQVRQTFISHDFCSLPFCLLGKTSLWSPNPVLLCFKWFMVTHRSDLLNLTTCVFLPELKWDDQKFHHLSPHAANGPCLASVSCSCVVCVICCIKRLLGVAPKGCLEPRSSGKLRCI